jgi:WD domain, G-beta repeat
MEAHESQLRGLALTADGTILATASEKGTVIRVWDVASAACIREFRRGVERANITCLAWSWDHHWLCCTSDKGTSHVFHMDITSGNGDANGGNDGTEEKKHADSVSSMAQMLFSTVRKSVEGDARKSVCQIRGVPHPQACAFVTAASSTNTHMVAVAGWDADGNGVLLLSEFSTAISTSKQHANEEAKRVGYHVLCKSAHHDESEEARRRRRLRGWTPDIPQTPEGGRLYVGERLEILERGMEQIHFEEGGIDDDEFVSVMTTPVRPADESLGNDDKATNAAQDTNGDSVAKNSDDTDLEQPSTVSDSVRTVPWDDDDNQNEGRGPDSSTLQ